MTLFGKIQELRAPIAAMKATHQRDCDYYRGRIEWMSAELTKKNGELASVKAERDAALKQIAFLERVIDRQRGPARVGHAGVPKKQQGPLNMRLVIVSREEAALLVPGVKYDSTGTVGSFEWGADYVEVQIAESGYADTEKMPKEDW